MSETRHAISIGRAARAAGSDYYFNSLRFAPANGAWAVVILATLFAAVIWPPAIALLVASAIPLAGIHRMAALLARGEPTTLSDFTDGMRRFGLSAVAIAAAVAILALVLVTNVGIGLASDNPIGWFLGASAAYGLAALAMFLVAAWPIVVDPRRETLKLRRRLQLAGLVLIGRPGRLFLVTASIVAILAVSIVLLAGIVLFGVAYASLLATRWVLPTADELEARYEAARASR